MSFPTIIFIGAEPARTAMQESRTLSRRHPRTRLKEHFPCCGVTTGTYPLLSAISPEWDGKFPARRFDVTV